MNAAVYFSRDYAEARAKFIATAEAAGGTLGTYVNPGARGPDGEELATDVARFGPADAGRVFLVNSGTHGVEGFCGSGCQIGLLAQGFHRRLPADTALVLSHAINPYGFAWSRRVTEDNVDLNRNFVDHARVGTPNAGYAELHEHLIPADWDGPARRAADQAIAAYVEKNGVRAFQSAVSGGQYRFPDGLFYGGKRPTWSNLTFNEIVRRHLGHARAYAFIDLHTGLGPSGYGEPIHVGPDYATTALWFGDDATRIDAGESASAVVHGSIDTPLLHHLPQAKGAGIALEFGTKPIGEVITALRADHWMHKHGDPASAEGRRHRAILRDAFFTDTDEWKERVLARTVEKFERAMKHLGAQGL